MEEVGGNRLGPFLHPRRLRYVLLCLVVVATLYFLFLVRQVIVPFLLAVVLAYLVFPLVNALELQGLKRGWAILMVYVGLALGLFLVLWYAVPAMGKELGQVAGMIPQYVGEAEEVADRMEQMSFPADSIDNIVDETINNMRAYLYSSLRRFMSGIFSFATSILSIVFAPILAFYLLKDWEKVRDGFLSLLPVELRREVLKLGQDIDEVLKEFIKGHLLVAAIVGVLTGLAMFALGVKFALLIGLICGVLELFPYFGPILGAVPAIGLAYSQAPRLAIYTALVILIIQQLECNILSPRILGDKVGLHPLFIVFALLAGAKLSGVWGMLLAVPVAAVAKILGAYLFYKAVK